MAAVTSLAYLGWRWHEWQIITTKSHDHHPSQPKGQRQALTAVQPVRVANLSHFQGQCSPWKHIEEYDSMTRKCSGGHREWIGRTGPCGPGHCVTESWLERCSRVARSCKNHAEATPHIRAALCSQRGAGVTCRRWSGRARNCFHLLLSLVECPAENSIFDIKACMCAYLCARLRVCAYVCARPRVSLENAAQTRIP
jgi:hypothetical protein